MNERIRDQYDTLMTYAKQTAADMDDTLRAAIESMRAESAEVARDTMCPREEIESWCDLQLAKGQL